MIMKRWTMKQKVWFAMMLIVLTVLVGAAAITMFLYDRLYVEKQIQTLMLHGEKLATVYETHGPDEYFFERLHWSRDSTAATILFTEDAMQLGSGIPFIPNSNEDLITFEERQQLLNGETVVMVRSHPRFEQDILGIAIPLFIDKQLAGAIFISMPLSQIQEPFSSIQWILISALIGVIMIIFLIANRIIHHLVTPLEQMKHGAMVMAGGDFTARMNEQGRKDELGQLAQSFNVLATSLEKVEENRREFLANVSHELRTPLSYMKGYAESMEEGVIPYKKGMDIIQTEAKRLERLVNDLLDLAQLEGESYPLNIEPIAFAQLIHDVVEPFHLIASKKKVTIWSDLDEDVIVYGDRDRIEQVIRNILDNALQYTPDHKNIFIHLIAKGSFAQLVISDEGIGIPEHELHAVTERFYRVDKARTRKKGGSGLGLAIVSQIIKKHRGQFSLSSKIGEGTKAKIVLKRAEGK